MVQRTKVIVAAMVVIIVVGALGGLMLFNKSANLLDSEFRIIVTNSMDGEPRTEYEIETIPVNSLIAVHKMHDSMLSDIKVGDVIGFHSPMVNGNVYHRVIEIDDVNKTITTRGDNATVENDDGSVTKTTTMENDDADGSKKVNSSVITYDTDDIVISAEIETTYITKEGESTDIVVTGDQSTYNFQNDQNYTIKVHTLVVRDNDGNGKAMYCISETSSLDALCKLGGTMYNGKLIGQDTISANNSLAEPLDS